MFRASINLAVALPAEAKPINRLFGLRRLQPVGDLPIYTGKHIALIVTGHGQAQMESGVRYLRQNSSNEHACWVNIGIAGHADLPLGAAMIASEVIGNMSGRTWLMDCPENLPCASGCVQTVAEPLRDYPGPCALDMEAEGFIAAASQIVPVDKIQVLKIISDNRISPMRGISAKMVRSLIEQQYGLIRQLIQQMTD